MLDATGGNYFNDPHHRSDAKELYVLLRPRNRMKGGACCTYWDFLRDDLFVVHLAFEHLKSFRLTILLPWYVTE
jgi:hypothetical protein